MDYQWSLALIAYPRLSPLGRPPTFLHSCQHPTPSRIRILATSCLLQGIGKYETSFTPVTLFKSVILSVTTSGLLYVARWSHPHHPICRCLGLELPVYVDFRNDLRLRLIVRT